MSSMDVVSRTSPIHTAIAWVDGCGSCFSLVPAICDNYKTHKTKEVQASLANGHDGRAPFYRRG